MHFKELMSIKAWLSYRKMTSSLFMQIVGSYHFVLVTDVVQKDVEEPYAEAHKAAGVPFGYGQVRMVRMWFLKMERIIAKSFIFRA